MVAQHHAPPIDQDIPAPRLVEHHVDVLMSALEAGYADAARTAAGVSWLDVHRVPARRLLARVVRRVLSVRPTDEYRPTRSRKRTIAGRSPSFGHVTYDVTEEGIAHLLGRVDVLPERQRARPVRLYRGQPPQDFERAPVCAVSWSSRHATTLLPVLNQLAGRGVTSTVIDLATDARQSFPLPPHLAISVVRPMARFPTGGLPEGTLRAVQNNQTVRVGHHELPIARVAALIARIIAQTSDVTQPSWATAVAMERWLDEVLAATRPAALLCLDDTSPPGLLIVRCAERAGAESVYVQHGAWVEGEIAWRAQHCRHIAVMGTRDLKLCRNWRRRPDARLHVVGLPRFDALADIDRRAQREYLEALFTVQTGAVPERMLVWGCQPHANRKLLADFRTLVDALWQKGCGWGLAIAPHPAQPLTALPPLLRAAGGSRVALAGPHIGARGCLAGADAFVTSYSTSAIEALLLDVPVLELVRPGERTLALSRHGAAQRCASGHEVAAALGVIERMPTTSRVPTTVKDSICRWDGRAAHSVADLVTRVLAPRKVLP
ncbi:hypothetical protein [Streptomyces sp. NPDC049881]|uniref:hypothetical protein n=1 Tax=Streptomyces sp. NPDC049881 TaxID=3155778 RepID=UPI003428D5E3